MSLPVSGLLVIDEQPGIFRFYKWQHVHVIVWGGSADGESARRLGRVTPKPPKGMRRSDVHIVGAGAGLPSADAREGFGQLMKDMADDIACLGVVIDGGGFWASAMRSAVIGIGFLAPKSLPFRAFGKIEDLVAWLPSEHRRRTNVPTDPVGLRRALFEAR